MLSKKENIFINFVLFYVFLSDFITAIAFDDSEKKGEELLTSYNSMETEFQKKIMLAKWNYETNMTPETLRHMMNIQSNYGKAKSNILKQMEKLDWENFRDQDLKNTFKNYLYSDTSYPIRETAFNKLVMKMSLHYEQIQTRECDYKNLSKCELNSDTSEILEGSQDPKELKGAWVEYHQRITPEFVNLFKEYVRSRKELYPTEFNETDMWLEDYRDSEIEQQLMNLWLEIRPLFLQMHAYIRKQLYDKYGPGVINKRGPIPDHLLGHLEGVSWLHLVSYTKPYPNNTKTNITEAMIKQNFTALKMFQMADEFFQSINLTAVNPGFWKNSILTYPNDGRNMNCHPTAFSLDDEDFRIKMCTNINDENLETAFHEMGHIQYYMQYSHQPFESRYGSNPGFHEAIGDLIALSATSSKHLRKIGLLEDDKEDFETEINKLYRKATDKLVTLSYAYLLDRYRFALFKDQIAPESYNCYFWKMKEAYQGVEPPIQRTEEDCDAVAIKHIPENDSVTAYFVSIVLEFQFHKALCKIAGEYEEGNENKKLSDCDIYQSVAAGNALGDMLKLGSSVHWREALKQLTGESEMDASGLLEYFEPLRVWLEKENERTGELIGWEKSEIEFCTEEQETKFQAVLANENMATILKK